MNAHDVFSTILRILCGFRLICMLRKETRFFLEEIFFGYASNVNCEFSVNFVPSTNETNLSTRLASCCCSFRTLHFQFEIRFGSVRFGSLIYSKQFATHMRFLEGWFAVVKVVKKNTEHVSSGQKLHLSKYQ